MRQGTEYNTKQDLGLGLLHWRNHVKAIQTRALLNYADGSRGDWKLVLDQWILSKHAAHGRGAISLGEVYHFAAVGTEAEPNAVNV